MLIPCPFCGPRDAGEFTCLGDGSIERPDPEAPDAGARFYAAVYLRTNPCGPHVELWYHLMGCRQWLRVCRDTRTHAVIDASLARQGWAPAGAAASGAQASTAA